MLLAPKFERFIECGILSLITLALLVMVPHGIGVFMVKPFCWLTKAVSGDDLDNVPVLASNSIRELNGLAASFNDIIVGLCG